MQRYEVSTPKVRARYGVRYIGGIGVFDVFWVADMRRLIVKWSDAPGTVCPVALDGAEDVLPLDAIKGRLARRAAPDMNEEEHTVLTAMRKLFVVE